MSLSQLLATLIGSGQAAGSAQGRQIPVKLTQSESHELHETSRICGVARSSRFDWSRSFCSHITSGCKHPTRFQVKILSVSEIFLGERQIARWAEQKLTTK